jgi:hypothetical protein
LTTSSNGWQAKLSQQKKSKKTLAFTWVARGAIEATVRKGEWIMLPSNLASQQHVFLIGEGLMFDEIVAHLLTPEPDLLVSHATYSDNPAFLNVVEGNRPNVILICDSGALNSARMLALVSSHPLTTGLRTIVIRFSNQVVDIYAKPICITWKAVQQATAYHRQDRN